MRQFIKDEFDKLALLAVVAITGLIVLVGKHPEWSQQAYHDAFIAFVALITGRMTRKDPPANGN